MFICSLPLESDDDNKDAAEVFESNILNSTVYIISIAFQVSTIAVNYRVNFEINQSINQFLFHVLQIIISFFLKFLFKGHPFMESFWENKSLMISIVGSSVGIICLAFGIFPDISQYLEIVDFSDEVNALIYILIMHLKRND